MNKIKLDRVLYILDMDITDIEVLFSKTEEGNDVRIQQFFEDIINDYESELINHLSNGTSDQLVNQLKVIVTRIDNSLKTIECWFPKLHKDYISRTDNQTDVETKQKVYDIVFKSNRIRYNAIKMLRSKLMLLFTTLEDKNNETTCIEDKVVNVINNEKITAIDKRLSNYDELMSMCDVCEVLKIQRNAVSNYIKDGFIKKVSQKGKRILIPKVEIRNYLLMHR